MTVSDQIIQVIDALCEKFGIAVNWTGENVIPYIEELCGRFITYAITTSVATIVIMTLLSIGSAVATKKLYPIFKKGLEEDARTYSGGWEVGSTLAIVGLVILNLATVIVICAQTMDIIKCITFPEMYIFEYVSSLIQQ